MIELLHYDFIRNALITGILTSIICGLIGPFVVVKRLVFISGGISHIAFGGLGLFYFLQLNPLFGAFITAVLTAVILSFTNQNKSNNSDARIGILWSLGMAIGIIFISLTPGFAPNLMTYLFGNILTVSRESMLITLALNILIALTLLLLYKEFVSIAFDSEFSKVQGIPVPQLDTLLLVLISITIVLLIQIVGIILVIAMLTIPTMIALSFAGNFFRVIQLSILIGIIMTLSGLFSSFYLDLPSGPVIIITGAVMLGFITLISKLKYKA